MNKKIGVLIPVYNEEKKIGKTLEDILKYTENIVVVNDGSKDQTNDIVCQYPVTLIDRRENKGLAKTVAEGFAYLVNNAYDYGIKVDGDGQMDADKLPEFFETIEKYPHIDVICATYNDDTPWMIKKDMMIYSFIYELATGIKTTDLLSEYRAYSKRGMQFLIDQTKDEGYGSPLILFDMHREELTSLEIKGGVSYKQKVFRPLPIDAQYALRKAFVKKTFNFPGLRSKAVAISSIPFWASLIVFNCTVRPKYHTFLPKRYVR